MYTHCLIIKYFILHDSILDIVKEPHVEGICKVHEVSKVHEFVKYSLKVHEVRTTWPQTV